MNKIDEKTFKTWIIGSESTGRGIYDCTDTILNLDNGKVSKINRKKLMEYLQ